MSYIRVSEDNIVIEISPVPSTENIFDYYVSGIAEQFIKVDAPANLSAGWKYVDGSFIEPPPPPEVLPPPPEPIPLPEEAIPPTV